MVSLVITDVSTVIVALIVDFSEVLHVLTDCLTINVDNVTTLVPDPMKLLPDKY